MTPNQGVSVLSVIIPAYNESNTIQAILSKIIDSRLDELKREVIIVDDCSSDSTIERVNEFCLQHPNEVIKCIRHQVNSGKGAALRTGISASTGDFIVIQDADLEYDPGEYNLLLKPLLMNHADVVYGSRFIGGKPHRILFFWHTIGNKILTFVSNMFTNLNLTDMETCYKAFRGELLRKINLRENRFGFEPEVTAKVARIKGIRIYEVGISYYGRTYAEGKKIGWKDAFRALFCILKYGLFRHN